MKSNKTYCRNNNVRTLFSHFKTVIKLHRQGLEIMDKLQHFTHMVAFNLEEEKNTFSQYNRVTFDCHKIHTKAIFTSKTPHEFNNQQASA